MNRRRGKKVIRVLTLLLMATMMLSLLPTVSFADAYKSNGRRIPAPGRVRVF